MSRRAAEEALPDYFVRQRLGCGSFGRVFLMEHRLTDSKLAIKTLNKERISQQNMNGRVHREISILLQIRHPNVIRLYNVLETSRYILLVMEYARNGELYYHIVEHGLTEAEARRVFQQLIAGVEFCHRRMIVHRDLKPENILLDEFNTVKIIDFGLGNFMTEGQFLKTSCGSPNYAAPEVISGRHYCGTEVDIWSCGVVLYTLLQGRLPFDEPSHIALYQRIRTAAYLRPSRISGAAEDLLSIILVADPTQRATIREIRRHPWFLPWFFPSDLLSETGPSRTPNSCSIANSQMVYNYRPPELHDSLAGQPAAGISDRFAWDDRALQSSSGGRETASTSGRLWSESGQLEQRVQARDCWYPGFPMSTLPEWWKNMQRVCQALQQIGVKWKQLGPCSLRCWKVVETPARNQEPSSHEQCSCQPSSTACYHDPHAVPLPTQLRFNIQIFVRQEGQWVLDLRQLGDASVMPLFDVFAELYAVIHTDPPADVLMELPAAVQNGFPP
eukprot:SM000406S15593  [mRNA]  locus=s406:38447:40942:+ [translate_table: standard]